MVGSVRGSDVGSPRMELDTLLVEELGQFGRFQLRTFLLAAVLVMLVAWSNLEYIFTTARIGTRCLISECEDEPMEFAPSWLVNAVPPGPTQGSFDNCERFGNTSASRRQFDRDICPSQLFDQDTRLPCDTFVYENTDSVVFDYGLACDEWRRSLIGTVTTFGTLTALPITGYISDRWGRRVALTINAFNTAWLGLTRYWADTYLGFVLSQFAEATFGCGLYSSIYILLTELVGPDYRVAVGAALKTCFALGQVTLGLLAWAVPNWRNLTLVIYTPQLLTIFYYWIISESVRWYMSKGRFDKSEALLKKVAKVNRRQLSDKSVEALRHTAEEKLRNDLKVEGSSGEPWLVVQVFRHKPILVRCMVSPVWWVTTTFIYYGLSLNAVNMSGNKYLNYIAVAAVEIPGFWTAYYLMGTIGRKPVLTGAFWLCSVCQLVYIFLPQGMYVASLLVYLIAKFAIAMVATSVYVYTAELYPTKYRHSLFAFSSMIGRIGSMLAPLTPAFGAQWFAELPFVMFGSLALVSGALIFLTPETLGTTLPDTFEQADRLGQLDQENKT
ncbi:organic cation transporter protein-like [Spodoptera frugiperda]|uniref:Organic cation transporter protein-like n=1 Tax=Spodoptera frugiperda TaxID=7108 RepID=A0A9R0EE83_SPOFR|nr:organic cation transporter protein-like [Spodoptera frugiperda]